MLEEFVKGDQVEVCSKQDGFLGSRFRATVLKKLSNQSFFYKVKYKNLITEEDKSQPLVEIISADEIRPVPPKTLSVMFRLHDKVDAWDNDGWWVGEITGQRGENLYSVYFATTDEVLEYPLNRLRRHLEFVNGDWVSSTARQQ